MWEALRAIDDITQQNASTAQESSTSAAMLGQQCVELNVVVQVYDEERQRMLTRSSCRCGLRIVPVATWIL